VISIAEISNREQFRGFVDWRSSGVFEVFTSVGGSIIKSFKVS